MTRSPSALQPSTRTWRWSARGTWPFVSHQPPKDLSDQAYIWVAANIGDPFYTDELKAWAAAVKDLGVKPTTIKGPVNQGVPTQDRRRRAGDRQPDDGGNLDGGCYRLQVDRHGAG